MSDEEDVRKEFEAAQAKYQEALVRLATQNIALAPAVKTTCATGSHCTTGTVG